MSTTLKVEPLLSHSYDNSYNLQLLYREERNSKKLESVATQHLSSQGYNMVLYLTLNLAEKKHSSFYTKLFFRHYKPGLKLDTSFQLSNFLISSDYLISIVVTVIYQRVAIES